MHVHYCLPMSSLQALIGKFSSVLPPSEGRLPTRGRRELGRQ